jgi:hypothetical protein
VISYQMPRIEVPSATFTIAVSHGLVPPPTSGQIEASPKRSSAARVWERERDHWRVL